MAFTYLYPDWRPYSTTYLENTWPEKAHHAYPLPFPVLRHQLGQFFHNKDLDIHSPASDVRETPSAFHVDVELPGTKTKSDVHVQWKTTRTILVSTHVERPPIEEETPTEDQNPDSEKKEANGELNSKPWEEKARQIKEHMTVHERSIGVKGRAFDFPVQVICDEATATLEAGLLRIRIPKATQERGSHEPVEIK